MILMMGEYDRYGKLCARVLAGRSSFLVDRTPLQLLDDTITYIGFDLRGAMASAKLTLGEKARCPIIVNPYQGIYLFPNKSPFRPDCIWFNPEHIVGTKAIGNKTKVELSIGHSIIVDSRIHSFNNRIQKANQLMQIYMKRGDQPSPTIFYLEPPKGHQLIREETGKYNFSNLEDSQQIND
jgi:competence protein ComK